MHTSSSSSAPEPAAKGGAASPPHGEKIPALDGFRGLAIAVVLLSHFLWKRPEWQYTPWWKLLQSGWLGVDLFFVLSGFLITGILLRSRGKPRYFSTFYRRRVLRIFPLYYAAVLGTWLWVVFVEGTPDWHRGYDHFAWLFLFVPDLAIALKNSWLYHSDLFNLNHLWSVAVEEQFYLVWPFLIRWLPGRWLVGLCAALLLAGPYLREFTDWITGTHYDLTTYAMPYCRLDGLATGSLLAACRHFHWGLPAPFQRYDRWLARALVLVFGARLAWMMAFEGSHYRGSVSAICFTALLYLALSPDPRAFTRRFFEQRWLQHLGMYSYALYVFHEMFENVWEQWFGPAVLEASLGTLGAQLVYIVLAFIGSYVAARLSWVIIERPFLRLKDRGQR
jgi:peptidoglycan/LPS O-acetylase OafA/YrhL